MCEWVSESVSEWVSDKVTYWAVCGQLKKWNRKTEKKSQPDRTTCMDNLKQVSNKAGLQAIFPQTNFSMC